MDKKNYAFVVHINVLDILNVPAHFSLRPIALESYNADLLIFLKPFFDLLIIVDSSL